MSATRERQHEKKAPNWTEWIASEEGKRCADFFTLSPPKGQQDYLENRLWAAFVAGAAYGRQNP